MSKKHYQAIAAIIATHSRQYTSRRPGSTRPAFERLTRNLADYFATENARFDRQRFLRACGVEE